MASHLNSYFLKLTIINFDLTGTYFYIISSYVVITSKLSNIDNLLNAHLIPYKLVFNRLLVSYPNSIT